VLCLTEDLSSNALATESENGETGEHHETTRLPRNHACVLGTLLKFCSSLTPTYCPQLPQARVYCHHALPNVQELLRDAVHG
jgi:hypothetical protein